MSPVSHLRARAHARAHLHTDIRVRACVWGTKTGGGGRMNRRTQHGPGPAPRSQTPDPASPERDARRISGRGRRVARLGVAATPRAGLSAEAEPATASPTRARGPLGAETAPAGRSLGTWEDAKVCHPRVESHQPERMAGESARQERRSRQKGMMERRGDRGVGRPATSRETERTLTETTK